jgi:uncharacterized phage-like protein YoqJ
MNPYYIVNEVLTETAQVIKKNFDVIVKIALVIAVIFAFKTCLKSCSQEAQIEPEIKAYVAAKSAVESQLNAPATAQFQQYNSSMVKSTSECYIVRGYVDSQNFFGAMLRSNFTVTLTKNMQVVSVEFD